MAAKVSVPVDLMSAVGMLLLMMGTSCAYDFYVGGRDGWVEKPSENFNDWAARNRFQVNDKLVFRYKKGEDSVLVVSEADYRSCSTSNPIQRLDGGDAVLQFDRSGPFFFISGTPGRCQSGQKLIVVVLAVRNPKPNPGAATPAPLPSPPTSSPLPSPPTAAPTPSHKAAAAPTPSPSTAHAPSPSTSAAPTPSPSTAHAPSPSTSAAPTPSSSLPSPAPSPSGQSAAPSPSESVPSPSLAPPADQVPEPSPAAPGPSTSNSSSSTPPPSSSSYTGASLWTVAVAWALGAVTFLVY